MLVIVKSKVHTAPSVLLDKYRISSIRRPPSNSSPPQIVALPSVVSYPGLVSRLYLAQTERNSGPPSIRRPSLRMRLSSYYSRVQKWLPSAAAASSTPEKPKGSFDSAFKLNILVLTLSHDTASLRYRQKRRVRE